MLAEERRRLDEAFRRVDRLREEGRHAEAIVIVQSLLHESTSHNGALKDRAGELIRTLAQEQQRGQARAADVRSRVEACLEKTHYDQACRLMDTLPEGLRTDDLRQLYQRADDARREVRALQSALAAAPDGRVSVADARKVERLLTLVPTHREATERARWLGGKLLAAGKEYLTRGHYREAHRALRAIPAVAVTSEVEELRAHAAEVVWLLGDLAGAPVVDPVLPLLAQRLARLRPQDERLARVAAKTRQRADEFLRGDGLEVPAWQTPPAEPALGCPVYWTTGTRRLAVGDDDVRGVLRRHPGRFWVAAGLALQGLGKGSVSLNLLPPEARGRLARWTGLALARPARVAWGVDLGSSGLKAVKLDISGDDDGVVIRRCDLVEHAKPLGQTADAAEKLRCIRETLSQFLERNPLGSDRVCLGFPSRHALYRTMDLPPLKPSKAASAIALEARHQLPCALEELIWQHQPLDQSDATDGGASRVFLAAAKGDYVRQQIALFGELGIHGEILQSDSLALSNFIDHEGEDAASRPIETPEEGPRAPATAVVDVGSEATNLIVRAPGLIWVNPCGFGGERFTRALAQRLRLTFTQAEQLKRNPAAAKDLVAVYEALDPLFDELIDKIERSLILFANAHRTHRVAWIGGTGGGLQVHGLLRRLQTARTPDPDS